MIPTIKQVMKCYRVIAQIKRMKTGRRGGFWLSAVVLRMSIQYDIIQS